MLELTQREVEELQPEAKGTLPPISTFKPLYSVICLSIPEEYPAKKYLM